MKNNIDFGTHAAIMRIVYRKPTSDSILQGLDNPKAPPVVNLVTMAAFIIKVLAVKLPGKINAQTLPQVADDALSELATLAKDARIKVSRQDIAKATPMLIQAAMKFIAGGQQQAAPQGGMQQPQQQQQPMPQRGLLSAGV